MVSDAASIHSRGVAQLIEYVAVLSGLSDSDEAEMRRSAVDLMRRYLDADVGVLAGPDGQLTMAGPATDGAYMSTLISGAPLGASTIEIAGVGTCSAAVVVVDARPSPSPAHRRRQLSLCHGRQRLALVDRSRWGRAIRRRRHVAHGGHGTSAIPGAATRYRSWPTALVAVEAQVQRLPGIPDGCL